MIAKRVVLTAQARRDVRQATAWYRTEGGAILARRWTDAVEAALLHIGENPRTGSSRYAVSLNFPGLRFWKAGQLPYLVFYIEHEHQVDIGRVLHEKRDIPTWMAGPAQ